MGNLIYCSYGTGPHVQEMRFSILSAMRFRGGWPGENRLLIYTDTPEAFAGLNAIVHPLSPEQLAAWIGPGAYHYRRKIIVLGMALRTYDGPSVLIDGDTYFLKPPARLFERIAPGRSLMHVREGRTGSLDVLKPLGVVDQTYEVAGERFTVGGDVPMWNSGVVGVHPADVAAVDLTVELCDAIQRQTPNRISEQIAFSLALHRRTRIVPARDVVYHYFLKTLRRPLHAAIPELERRYAGLPLPEQGRAWYRSRPRSKPQIRLRQLIKRSLRPLGLFQHDYDRSF